MKLQHRELYELHAEVCKALANPKRLMIIALLSEGEKSVGEIVEAIHCPPANVSQHLRVLRSRLLVESRKEGQTVYYRLTDERLPAACSQIRSILLEGMKRRGKAARAYDRA